MHGQKISIANLTVLSKNGIKSMTGLLGPTERSKMKKTQNINAAATTTASTGTAAAAPAQPSMMGMAMPFVIMLAVMYFLMIRPQQKKMKEHQGLMSGLKDGDEVITSSGILGTIQGMSDKVVTLEVAKNVQLKILKSQVNQVVKGPIQDIKA